MTISTNAKVSKTNVFEPKVAYVESNNLYPRTNTFGNVNLFSQSNIKIEEKAYCLL